MIVRNSCEARLIIFQIDERENDRNLNIHFNQQIIDLFVDIVKTDAIKNNVNIQLRDLQNMILKKRRMCYWDVRSSKSLYQVFEVRLYFLIARWRFNAISQRNSNRIERIARSRRCRRRRVQKSAQKNDILNLLRSIQSNVVFWFDQRDHFTYCFEKTSNANLSKLYNEKSLNRSNQFVTYWTVWFHCRCKNQKNQCRKKIFSICTIISVMMQNACNNARLLITFQNINNTQKNRSNQKLWSLTSRSIHTQKSYHDAEWIDQSFEKRAFAIDHAR